MARSVRTAAWLGGLILVGTLFGCVPLPVHVTPPVSGQVLDARSEAPVEGAVVVVRYDASHGDLLPDRDLLAHREVVTDGNGRFALSRATEPGLSAWPAVRTEARVVGVIKDGYRCAAPQGVPPSGRVVLRIDPVAGLLERRASCRPVAARPSEAPRYLAAWRGLYPRDEGAGRLADERRLGRLLAARRVFGPGENCTGPVVDLALDPSGERVGVVRAEESGRTVEVVRLTASGPQRLARVPVPSPEASAGGDVPRRLAWASQRELLLWEPAALDPTFSPSGLATRGPPPAPIWSEAAPPASRAATPPTSRVLPVQPPDLHDAAQSRWNGRSFHIERSLDPITGLGAETLRIEHPGGQPATRVALPGEACGPSGEYGRPHDRIAADGQVAVDLRHVDGGCHAVAIHLGSGHWRRIDGSRAPGVCTETRRVPLPQLRVAMRGYVRDLEDAVTAAGGDPGAAYSLRIGREGRTRLESRNLLGERLSLHVAPFPIETPLSRIEVTAMANAGQGAPAASGAAPRLNPL